MLSLCCTCSLCVVHALSVLYMLSLWCTCSLCGAHALSVGGNREVASCRCAVMTGTRHAVSVLSQQRCGMLSLWWTCSLCVVHALSVVYMLCRVHALSVFLQQRGGKLSLRYDNRDAACCLCVCATVMRHAVSMFTGDLPRISRDGAACVAVLTGVQSPVRSEGPGVTRMLVLEKHALS